MEAKKTAESFTRAEIVAALLEMFKQNDRDPLVRMLAADAVTRIPERLPYGGTYNGPEGFDGFFQDLFDNYYDSFVYDTDGVLDAVDQFAVPVRIRAQGKSGRTMEIENLWLFKVRDGRVYYAQLYADTAAGSTTAG
jgi:ketosteroid isomerase-like protein